MSSLAVSQFPSSNDDSAASPAAQRFHALVASPLRAELIRFLHAHSRETFEIETLMGALGCMRADVERCLESLVSAGVARRWAGGPHRFGASRPANPVVD